MLTGPLIGTREYETTVPNLAPHGPAVKVLRIHRNTVAYALRKVEQLTVLSLDSVRAGPAPGKASITPL